MIDGLKQPARQRAERLIDQRRRWRALFFGDRGRYNRDGKDCMTDLEKFCYANKSTAKVSPVAGTIDPIAMGIAEGRRETYNYIKALLETPDDAFNKIIEQLTNHEEE